MTLNLFVPLTKVDAVQRLVYGTLVAEEVDKSGEIFDYESSKQYVEEWSSGIAKATEGKSVGNLRAMHGKIAAGKFTELTCDDKNKRIEVCAKVVDNDEWTKVEEGVYTGFSIGGKYLKKWKDKDGHQRYTAQPSEGSLVDNPCGPTATFSMVKADGSTEIRKFNAAFVEGETSAAPVVAELEQVWKCTDGATFATKAEAKAHNEELAKAKEPANALTAVLANATAAMTKVEESRTEKPAEKPAEKPVEKVVSVIAEKVAPAEEFKKGLYDVCRLASLISELEWLQQSSASEAASEADGSAVPAQLKASVAALCATLRAMVVEETSELFDDAAAATYADILEMSARPRGLDELVKELGDNSPAYLAKAGARHGKSDKEHLDAAHDNVMAMGIGKCAGMGKSNHDALGKMGARHSKADAQHLQDAHDSLTKAGAGCPAASKDAKSSDDDETDKSAPIVDLAKSLEDAKTKNATLEKTITESVAIVSDLVERIKKLEAQPMPDPRALVSSGTVRVVEKADDAQQAREHIENLRKNDPESLRLAMIQFARQNPVPINR